jgi:hypothetical protein
MAVTASNAATAGGTASDLWFLEFRCGLPPLWPLALTECVEVATPGRVGVRGGMTTGLECMGAADAALGLGCDVYDGCSMVGV